MTVKIKWIKDSMLIRIFRSFCKILSTKILTCLKIGKWFSKGLILCFEAMTKKDLTSMKNEKIPLDFVFYFLRFLFVWTHYFMHDWYFIATFVQHMNLQLNIFGSIPFLSCLSQQMDKKELCIFHQFNQNFQYVSFTL